MIRGHYGPDYTTGPRRYKTKSKGAQEAHEAIRPTDVNRLPDDLVGRLDGEELAVYRLIWNRTVASQMANATLDKTAADMTATVPGEGGTQSLTFRANGSVVRFPGFLKVYGDRGKDSLLPDLTEGMSIGGEATSEAGPAVALVSAQHAEHETQPPARYTEASLIKKLEDEGIGRPSTYAAVVATIQSREYVIKKGGALLPSYIGMAVTDLLRKHFNKYVDIRFTALMEEDLDRIASGDADLAAFLDRFYRGDSESPGLEQEIAAESKRLNSRVFRSAKTPKPACPSCCASGAIT